MTSLKRSLKNLYLDISVTMSSLLVMTLTFFSIAVFLIFGFYTHFAIKHLEQSPQIFVYFTDNATEEYVLEVKAQLEKAVQVSEVRYTSKELALETYVESNKDNPLLLESISANIFPASLDIKASNISYFDEIITNLEVVENIESIDFQEVVIERLKDISNKSRIIGVSLITLLIIMSFLNTLLTVGMTIRAQKREIEVMKLVGASNWFIIKPYLAQGILYAVISSFIVGLLLFISFPFMLPQIESFFTGVPIPTISDLFQPLGIVLGGVSAGLERIILLLILTFLIFIVGLIVALFGSLVAVSKYLRV